MKRLAVVTGGGRGIGRETVRQFLEMEWEVYAVDVASPRKPLPGVNHIKLDVSDALAIETFYANLEGQIEGIHALVNNAAMQICKPLLETTVEDWNQVLDTNLRSVFLMAKYGFSFISKVEGAIINVSSVHSIHTSKDIAAYAASKGGMTALTRAMALEFANDGIRVNAVLPGAVDTLMLREGLSRAHVSGSMKQRLEDLASRHVLGRIGTPQEIARAIYFLADPDQSGFITGQTLVIDGGATARLSTE
jgi:NAD(P)-dependent dehydrogenase (short-subunit alcohol dehydrogenase family)